MDSKRWRGWAREAVFWKPGSRKFAFPDANDDQEKNINQGPQRLFQAPPWCFSQFFKEPPPLLLAHTFTQQATNKEAVDKQASKLVYPGKRGFFKQAAVQVSVRGIWDPMLRKWEIRRRAFKGDDMAWTVMRRSVACWWDLLPLSLHSKPVPYNLVHLLFFSKQHHSSPKGARCLPSFLFSLLVVKMSLQCIPPLPRYILEKVRFSCGFRGFEKPRWIQNLHNDVTTRNKWGQSILFSEA